MIALCGLIRRELLSRLRQHSRMSRLLLGRRILLVCRSLWLWTEVGFLGRLADKSGLCHAHRGFVLAHGMNHISINDLEQSTFAVLQKSLVAAAKKPWIPRCVSSHARRIYRASPKYCWACSRTSPGAHQAAKLDFRRPQMHRINSAIL